jgi:hypothetical protein
MIRTILLALLGAILVLALALCFPLLHLGWYGDLLCEACILFGGFGLIAGFACGALARRQSAPAMVLGGGNGAARGRFAQAASNGRTEPDWPDRNSPFITSPIDVRATTPGAASRRPTERMVK